MSMCQIRLARPVEPSTPARPRGQRLQAGQLVTIWGWVEWPGLVNERGQVAESWAFWSSYDIDGALIFDVRDVAELLITPAALAARPGLAEQLASAPFSWRIVEGQGAEG